MKHASLSLLSLACLTAGAAAQTIHLVPQEHPTIQEAVDVAGANDIIIIGAGTYQEAVVVNAKSNLVIQGKGKVVIDPPSGNTGLTLDGCNNCNVEKIRVAGGQPYGILLVDTTDCGFSKCRVDDSATDGIRVEGGGDCSFDKCTVKNAGNDAISFTQSAGSFTHDNLVTKCKLIAAQVDAIDVEGNDNTFDKCTILKPLGSGFTVDDITNGHDNELTNSKVIKPGGSGVVITGDNNAVRACRLIGAGDRGVHVLQGSFNTVEDCKVPKPAEDGIRSEPGCGQVNVTGCKIPKPGDDGVEMDGDDAVVDGNRVTGALDDGFEIDGLNGSYTNNIANGSKDDGFVLSEGEGNTLTGNKAHGNKSFDLDDIIGEGLNDWDNGTNSFGKTGP
ncbi:MAG TPA: right-handed parallel beta-helix repeat-containing protein [Planctomycetota bacterium]|nr:right-handed parallel beta-helix repeat-containing protein [Planctomycetota bacterium]